MHETIFFLSQALQGIRLVLTPIQQGDEAAMSVDGNDGSRWLMEHLPGLPCFKEFYPHISSALRNACNVENDPNVVGMYIQFLANYVPQVRKSFFLLKMSTFSR